MNKRPRMDSLGPVLESALRATAIFAVLILVVRVAEVILGRLVG